MTAVLLFNASPPQLPARLVLYSRVLDICGRPVRGATLTIGLTTAALVGASGTTLLAVPLTLVTAADGSFACTLVRDLPPFGPSLAYRITGPGVNLVVRPAFAAHVTPAGPVAAAPSWVAPVVCALTGSYQQLGATSGGLLTVAPLVGGNPLLVDGSIIISTPQPLTPQSDGALAVNLVRQNQFQLPGTRVQLVAGARAFALSVPNAGGASLAAVARPL